MAKAVVALPVASITAATPKLAPAVIPRTDGPANGFLKSVCICKPATDSALPAKIAVIALGNLIFRIMLEKPWLSDVPNKEAQTSDRGIVTEPKAMSSIKSTSNPMIIKMINFQLKSRFTTRLDSKVLAFLNGLI
jgi:hypothetical protein